MHILVILGFLITMTAAMVSGIFSIGLPSWAICALLAAELVLVWLGAEWVSSLTARRIMHRVARPNPSILGFERLKLIGRILVLLLHAANLFVLGWPELVLHTWNLKGIPAVHELVLIAPFIAMVILLLAGLYRGDRMIRVRHAESRVRAGAESTPLWTRRQFLDFHIRQSLLIVLIPIVPLLAIKDVLLMYERQVATVPEWILLAGLGGLIAAMFLLSPLVIRLAWGTKRLPDGPLRQRLVRLCERANLRYRDLLLWRTHGVILNAGVIGYIGPLRYILVTDAAIEQLSDAELEAVFGHEIGHVIGRHFLYFFLFFVGVMGFWMSIGRLMPVAWPDLYVELVGAAVTITLAGWLFGMMSRRFEREADLYGVQHAGCGDPRCPDACPITSVPVPPGLSPVCPAAVEQFVLALEKIAWLNGSSLNQRSWRHFSVRLRREFLLSCTVDPFMAARFGRHVRFCKFLLVVTIALLAGLALALILLPPS